MTREETRNLLKTAQTSKVVNPFTRALAPPFIGRRRDFYIPKVPSNPRNIPNVNTYMNVFYISYIYKFATSSHAKPKLFEATSLTWLLARSRVSPFGKSSYAVTSELGLQRIPEFRRLPISWSRTSSQVRDLRSFAGLRLQIFTGSQLPSFAGLRLQIFASSRLRSFAGSRFQIFASSPLRSFAGSRFQIFASSRLRGFAGLRFLKTHFTNFIIPDVSRVTGFPEFPNTSPSGKRVDSDDPIPRKSQNFGKKRHPRNVGVDTRPPEISQRSNRGGFLKLPPPRPYK
jgi:hypothetical protein